MKTSEFVKKVKELGFKAEEQEYPNLKEHWLKEKYNLDSFEIVEVKE